MEHSLFPRKRTLLGRARGHHAERNALRNRLANQAKEAKNGPKHGHGNHHHTGEPGRQGRDTSGTKILPLYITKRCLNHRFQLW